MVKLFYYSALGWVRLLNTQPRHNQNLIRVVIFQTQAKLNRDKANRLWVRRG